MRPAQLPLLDEPRAPNAAPVVVSYGAGVDSTALLAGMAARGERPDLILFADTGDEHPETYAFLPVIRAWLASVGFPGLVIVRRRPVRNRRGTYRTLLGSCLVNHTLPSIAFHRRGCSVKWKGDPMDRFVRAWAPARAARAAGLPVWRLIGYDAGPADCRRSTRLEDGTGWFRYRYPLREWGWDRERCAAEILAAGLPLPPKSACWFCSAQKPEELAELHYRHPELTTEIRRMEANAAPYLREIHGLWGRGRKGTRGGIAMPGSMTVFLRVLDEAPAERIAAANDTGDFTAFARRVAARAARLEQQEQTSKLGRRAAARAAHERHHRRARRAA